MWPDRVARRAGGREAGRVGCFAYLARRALTSLPSDSGSSPASTDAMKSWCTCFHTLSLESDLP